MKEVYCINCKYFYNDDYEPECHHSSNTTNLGNWLKKFKVYNLFPKEKNHLNRCTFYTRLCYKFWVK